MYHSTGDVQGIMLFLSLPFLVSGTRKPDECWFGARSAPSPSSPPTSSLCPHLVRVECQPRYSYFCIYIFLLFVYAGSYVSRYLMRTTYIIRKNMVFTQHTITLHYVHMYLIIKDDVSSEVSYGVCVHRCMGWPHRLVS